MLDFSLDDVQQFLHSWYAAVETGLNEDNNYWRTRAQNAAEELSGRIAGNKNYEKLAINPLMLQLIALVHYDYKTVPDRRVELYQKCIDLLLQKWDEAKGLKALLTVKEARQVLHRPGGWRSTPFWLASDLVPSTPRRGFRHCHPTPSPYI